MATSIGVLVSCARQISTKNKVFFRRISPALCAQRHLSSNEQGEVVDEDVTDTFSLEEFEIDRIRDVSGLSETNRRRMAHARQMPEIKKPFQETTKYQRKLYAMFGKESGIDPKIFWPTLDELKEMRKEEEEWEPSLQERWAKLKSAEQDWQQRRKKRYNVYGCRCLLLMLKTVPKANGPADGLSIFEKGS